MRALIQRVQSASVEVNQELIAEIGSGLLILLGIEDIDTELHADLLIEKISNLRIFPDQASGKELELSLIYSGLEVLIVSQFTLYAELKKGRRPDFGRAMKSALAQVVYDQFCDKLASKLGRPVKKGKFGAHMHVSLVNDGPVTIMVDSLDLLPEKR
jgi:D-tyrosyl-tRNA(Tyr) deacylase